MPPMNTRQTTTLALVLASGYFLTCAVAQEAARKPNILFVLLDDLGYRDIGFRDSQFQTPTIDELYNNGVRFNQSYTTPNCGPSRAALLSGLYPYRLGLQGNAINSRSSAAVPKHKPLLPEALRDVYGYQTHLVGKWHQGFCNKGQTPNKRGFDSFFGFYLTKQDHFTHMSKKDGYDFRRNFDVDRSVEGKYSTTIYTQRVREIIAGYKEDLKIYTKQTKPFFILLSHAAIHGPSQVPRRYVRDTSCANIDDAKRRIKCGMMAAVDEGLRDVIKDLRDLGVMNNTLIVFTSDEGGSVSEGSSNWPLRGEKRTLWEGGIRVNTFMYSESTDILPSKDFTYEGLFYITDFYATLLGLVGNLSSKKVTTPKKVPDSYNNWKFIKEVQKQKSYRNRIAYVDQDLGIAMYRDRNWKLLYQQSRHPGWYNPPPGVEAPEEPDRRDISKYQLFDLDLDPNETSDVKRKNPDRWMRMAKKLGKVIKHSTPPVDERLDSDPDNFDGVWSPGWCGDANE